MRKWWSTTERKCRLVESDKVRKVECQQSVSVIHPSKGKRECGNV
jgi:hypothetical protein